MIMRELPKKLVMILSSIIAARLAKRVKVMFSQVSVCSQGGGLPSGRLPSGGSASGGLPSEGVCHLRGICIFRQTSSDI